MLALSHCVKISLLIWTFTATIPSLCATIPLCQDGKRKVFIFVKKKEIFELKPLGLSQTKKQFSKNL